VSDSQRWETSAAENPDQQSFSEENPGVNANLQIFNKTKCANLVSNVADAIDQSRLGEGSAVPNIPFLSYGLFEQGMAVEAV
jgi:hypothetical protein